MDIKDRRIELNLTMKEVAEYVGVTEATVSRWESGNIANMKRSRIKTLAEILQVSPLDILGNADDMGPELSANEKDLVTLFREMNEEGQEVALNVLRGLIAGGQYQKKHDTLRLDKEEA